MTTIITKKSETTSETTTIGLRCSNCKKTSDYLNKEVLNHMSLDQTGNINYWTTFTCPKCNYDHKIPCMYSPENFATLKN